MTMVGRGQQEIAEVLGALGAAWTTFRLYPNPTGQPAYQRAMHVLAGLSDDPLVIEVGAGSFIVEGREFAPDRDGVERLARELFVRDVEAVRFGNPPSSDELRELFRLVSATDLGGTSMQDELEHAGVSSISVRQRGLLSSAYPEGGEHLHGSAGAAVPDGDDPRRAAAGTRARRSELAGMIEAGATPEEVAARIAEQSKDDHAEMAERYTRAYREVYGEDLGPQGRPDAMIAELLAPYWHDDDPGRTLRTFVEAYFLLPADVQGTVLAGFLGSTLDLPARIFLDQLSGHELAEVARALPEEQFGVLIEYACEVTGGNADRQSEVLRLLRSARYVKESRRNMADRISELLATGATGSGDLAATVRHEMLADLAKTGLDLEAFRALLASEDRAERFGRLLRVWAGRVAANVRAGEITQATRLVEAVRVDPVYPPESRLEVEAALSRGMSREMIGDLFSLLGTDATGEVLEFLHATGPAGVDRLIEQLGEEEDRQVRRAMLDLLTELSKGHQRSLLRHLSDPRWYVVRNLAIVLGRIADQRVVSPLRALLGHEDHRVRVEAMRALTRIDPSGGVDLLIAALEDGHRRVRNTALTLLRGLEVDGVDAALLEVFDGAALGADELTEVARLLLDRGVPESIAVVRAMASRSFIVKPSHRAARQAARTALGRSQWV